MVTAQASVCLGGHSSAELRLLCQARCLQTDVGICCFGDHRRWAGAAVAHIRVVCHAALDGIRQQLQGNAGRAGCHTAGW
jgi:hypothetical protein